MKAIFSGGGTGGHLYPAISLINYMRKIGILDDLKYTGGKGIESKVVPNYKIDYIGYDIEGLKRPKTSLKNVKIILNYYKIAKKLKSLIKEFKPDFVFVTGGYASIPVSIAAKKLGIPLFNQEQNIYVGFANRYINKFATITFTNFKESIKYFPKKENIVIAKNPVMRKPVKKDAALRKFNLKDKFTIGVFGGSGGSEKINDCIKDIYKNDSNNNYIHVTGERDYKRFENFKKDNVRVIKYCKNMDEFYSASDLIICRAGAMTISELMFMKKPAILIPHPFAAEDHQFYNAKYLQDKGIALTIKDSKLNSNVLQKSINELKADMEEVLKRYESINYENSMDLIVKKILEVTNEKDN